MKNFFFYILLFFNTTLFSQVTYVIIDSIQIDGNKKTKDYIITNDLDIKIGDTISFNDLAIRFRTNKNRILGTDLFVDVNFNLKSIDTKTGKSTLLLSVIESWYIYPIFIFDLVDRNFNEWYYNYGASLKRISYGLDIEHKNTTGNNDPLRIKLQGGVTKKIELKYIRPYLNKFHKIGFLFNILYKHSKEIPYNTRNNKLVIFRNENNNLFNQFRITTGISFKPNIFNTHSFNFKFYQNKIDQLVVNNYNANFFSNSKIKQYFFSTSYSFLHDNREFKLYPRGGYLVGVSIEKTGLGIFNDINQLSFQATYEKYFSINKRFISTYKLKGKKRLLGKESPYFNNKALGYEDDFLNGYELYVIDGKDFAYIKSSQKLKFLSGVLDLNNYSPIKQFKLIPYEFYLSINHDVGYVNNNVNFVANNFTNRILYGYGLGIDIIVYNNLFRISYSYNHTGESGLFFLIQSSI